MSLYNPRLLSPALIVLSLACVVALGAPSAWARPSRLSRHAELSAPSSAAHSSALPGATSFVQTAAGLQPVFEQRPVGSQQPATVTLPPTADVPFSVADAESGLHIRARLIGLRRSPAVRSGEFVVYREAIDGGDYVHRPNLEGTEDSLYLRTPRADHRLSYSVELDEQVAGVRLVSNTLEFLDRKSVPRLRVSHPTLIDRNGEQHSLKISVSGCAYDSNPADPFSRPPTPPKSSQCRVDFQWSSDVDGLFPALFDPSWSTTGSMALHRSFHQSVLLSSSRVLAVGGYCPGSKNTVDCAPSELFDQSTHRWAMSGTLHGRGRFDPGLVVLSDGRVIVAGGDAYDAQGHSGLLDSMEIYEAGYWNVLPTTMSEPRSDPVLALLDNGNVLIIGGYADYGNSNVTDEYSQHAISVYTTHMKEGRVDHRVISVNDVIFVAGGADRNNGDVERYDYVTRSWLPSFSIQHAPHYLDMALLPSGQILVVTPYVQLLDPTTGTNTQVEYVTLTSDAFFGTGSAGISIRVGGEGSSSVSKSLYFDASGNHFDGPVMANAHDNGTLTVMDNGEVLVAGGNSTGLCEILQLPVGCTTGAECSSGFCSDGFCCDTACGDACDRCDVAGKWGTCTLAKGDVGAPSCSPYVCDGVSTSCPSSCTVDADCVKGSMCAEGQCVPLPGLGTTCTAGSQCASGFCSDGVCCDAACTGSCDRCDDAKHLGTCALLEAGSAPAAGECAPMVCDGASGSCPETCLSNANCSSDYVCVDGACMPGKEIASSCTSNAECGSGFCADGVCCNAACAGSCATCTQPGAVGTCQLVAGAAAPGRESCAGEGTCGRTCDGIHAECAFPGAETLCSAGFCGEAVMTPASTCDGHGRCAAGEQQQCGLGCAGDHCATPVPASGCASTDVTGFALLLPFLLLAMRRRSI